MWEQNLENLENREEMKKRNYRGQGSGARGQGVTSYLRPVRELACTFGGSSNTTELAAVTRARDNREAAGGRGWRGDLEPPVQTRT